MAEFPDYMFIKNRFTSKGGGSCRSTICAYLLDFDYLPGRSSPSVTLCVCISFGPSIAIMPYYKPVARTSGPMKCNACRMVSRYMVRDPLSLIVHRLTLGIIFAVTGGSEQGALDRPVLKFLSISECKDPRRTEPSSRPDVDFRSTFRFRLESCLRLSRVGIWASRPLCSA